MTSPSITLYLQRVRGIGGPHEPLADASHELADGQGVETVPVGQRACSCMIPQSSSVPGRVVGPGPAETSAPALTGRGLSGRLTVHLAAPHLARLARLPHLTRLTRTARQGPRHSPQREQAPQKADRLRERDVVHHPSVRRHGRVMDSPGIRFGLSQRAGFTGVFQNPPHSRRTEGERVHADPNRVVDGVGNGRDRGMRAWGCGLLRIFPWSMPGKTRSSVNRACPVDFSRPSTS